MLMFGDVMEGRGRDNNFLIIRLLAATAVVVGHSFALSYLECLSCTDPGLLLGMPVPVHSLGVEVFFMVSGFLIAASDPLQQVASACLCCVVLVGQGWAP